MRILKVFFPLLVILVLSLFSVIPFFRSGFFPIHDNTQVARVYEMTKALSNGQFPVRWSQDLGYGFGYPIFNFYDPLPYYIGGLMGFLNFDALASTKIMMVLAILFSAFSMYILAKEFWGKWGGVLSSLFYLYAPYHGVDIYVRGDVAEFWAYGFIPLVFYGLWKTYKEGKWKYVVVSSLSFGGIIASHNLTALMITPFLILFAAFLFIKIKDQKRIKILYIISAFVLGLLISASYWIPAIFEMNYTNILSQIGGGADFRDHFVCFSQLWTSPWGYGGSAKGCMDGISFMIGKYHIMLSAGLFLLSIFFIFSKKYQNYFSNEKEKLVIVILSFFGFLIGIFFTLQVSQPIWEIIKPMAFFQYPWRFLILIVFFSSFICGSFFWMLSKFIKEDLIRVAAYGLSFIFIVLVSVKFFLPQEVLNKTVSDYTSSYALRWTTSKTSDEYMPKNFQKPKNYSEVASFSGLNSKVIKITKLDIKTQEIKLRVVSLENTSLVLPVAYFPAWNGRIDGKSLTLTQNKRGMLIMVPKGEHDLILNFSQTQVEVFGNIASVAGVLSLLLGIIYFRKKYE